MKRALSLPLLKHSEEIDHEKEGKYLKNRVAAMNQGGDNEYGAEDIAKQFQCMTLPKPKPTTKRGLKPSWKRYGLWTQGQKMVAAGLDKQLKARWALDERIEKRMNRFHAHYNRPIVTTKLRDVSQLLMPKWAPSHELASLAWLGDWRPSAILALLRSLARSPSWFSSSLPDSVGIEQVLSQLIQEIRIEEAVIDEEMAEIQANCILHLDFAPTNNQPSGSAMACVRSEFKKINRVITKAQNLRFKAVGLVVKKVLSQTDAAEFIVAFAGIQDSIHQFAAHYKQQKGPSSLPVEAFGF